METILPLIPFVLIPLFLTASLIPLIKRLSWALDMVDRPTTAPHKSHTSPIPYGGAIAITLGTSLSLFMLFPDINTVLAHFTDNQSAWRMSLFWLIEQYNHQTSLISPLLSCAMVMVIIGVIDDCRNLSPLFRILTQFTSSTLLVFTQQEFCMSIFEHIIINQVISVLWIVTITNAFNFIDNMDGLSGGIGAIILLLLGFIALLIGQTGLSILCFSLFGSLCGFLLFNLPPASIYMGDAGGLALGFIISAVAINLSQVIYTSFLDPVLQFAPLMVLLLPLYDILSICLIRIRFRQFPWNGDNNHISHRLVRHGLSKQNTVLVLYFVVFILSLPLLICIHPSGSVTWIWATPLAALAICFFDIKTCRAVVSF